MSGTAKQKRGFLHVLERIVKIVFFPLLVMVNPKIYFSHDEEDRQDD